MSKSEFEKARDEYLESIRLTPKQDESTALQLSAWTYNYLQAENTKLRAGLALAREAMENVKHYIVDFDAGHKFKGKPTKCQQAIMRFVKTLSQLDADADETEKEIK